MDVGLDIPGCCVKPMQVNITCVVLGDGLGVDWVGGGACMCAAGGVLLICSGGVVTAKASIYAQPAASSCKSWSCNHGTLKCAVHNHAVPAAHQCEMSLPAAVMRGSAPRPGFSCMRMQQQCAVYDALQCKHILSPSMCCSECTSVCSSRSSVDFD